MQNYEINRHYPISELDAINKWWLTHPQYAINEYRESREYDDDGNEVQREYNDYVEIVPRDTELVIIDLRERREHECFQYVNRGSLWYDTLTTKQRAELQEWYIAWLNVTDTLDIPQKPEWL